MAFTLKKLATPLLAASLLLPSLNAFSASTVAADPFTDDRPSALAMVTDLVILRPLGTAATAVGGVAWLLSLPFTLPVGGADEAGHVLVGEPAVYTFYRCLGCTRPGHKENNTMTNGTAAQK